MGACECNTLSKSTQKIKVGTTSRSFIDALNLYSYINDWLLLLYACSHEWNDEEKINIQEFELKYHKLPFNQNHIFIDSVDGIFITL